MAALYDVDPDLVAVHALRDANRVSRRTFLGAALGVGGMVAAYAAGRRGRSPEYVASAFRVEPLTHRLGRVSNARFRGRERVVFGAAWGESQARVFQLQGGSMDEVPTIEDRAVDVVAVTQRDEVLINADLQYGPHLPTGTMMTVPLDPAGASVQIGVQDGDAGDDGWIAFVARTSDGYQINAPADVIRVRDKRWLSNVRISRDGKWLAFVRQGDEIVLYDLASNGQHVLTNHWHAITGLAWADDSQSLWFSGSRSGRAQLHQVTLAGEVRQTALSVAESIRLCDVAVDGRMLVALDQHRRRSFVDGVSIGRTETADIAELAGSTVLMNEEDGAWLVPEQGEATLVDHRARGIAVSPSGFVATQDGDAGIVVPALAGRALEVPGWVSFGRWISDREMLVVVGDNLYRVGMEQAPKAIAVGHPPFVLDRGRTRCAFRLGTKLVVIELATNAIRAVAALEQEEVCGWLDEPDAIMVRTTRFPVTVTPVDLHGTRLQSFAVEVPQLGQTGITAFFVDGMRTAYSYREQLSQLSLLRPV